MITLAEAAILVRPDFSRAAAESSRGARKVGEQAGRETGNAFGGTMTDTIKSFSGRAVMAMSAVTAAVTGAGLAGLVTFGLKTAASLEQAEIGFKTLLGSGKASRAFLEDLKSFAAKTPFELPGLIESSRTLLGVGVSAKDVVPILQSFGDAAGAVGVGQEAFQRIMLATSQAISAGRFGAGDLNQIMTNGIPIWTLLSKAMGKTTPELRLMAEKGLLLSKDVLPLLQAQMSKDYGGAMAEQSKTLAGVWSTLKDTVAIGLADAIKPLLPLLKDLVPKAAAAASTGLKNFSEGVKAAVASFKNGKTDGEGFVGGMQVLGVAADKAWAALKAIGTVLKDDVVPFVKSAVKWFADHETTTKALGIAIGSAIVITKAWAAAVYLHTVATRVWGAALTVSGIAVKAWTALNWLATPPVAVNTLAMKASRSTIATWLGVKALEAAAWARSAAATVAGTVATTAHTVVTKAARVATIAWTAVTTALGVAMKFALGPIGIIITVIALVAAGVIYAYKHNEKFRAIVDAVWKGIKAAIGAVASWFTNTVIPSIKRNLDRAGAAFEFMKGVVGRVWNGIKNTISTVVDAVVKTFNNLRKWITETIPNAFRRGVDGIRSMWHRVQDAARKPVAFVVNQVINPLARGFNRVAGFLGVKGRINEIGGFAHGGKLPGPASNVDNMVARGPDGRMIGLASGEYVVNARSTKKHLPAIEAINADRGFADGGLFGFLKGPANWVKGLASKGLAKIGQFGDTPFVQALKGMGTKLRDGILDKVKGVFTGGSRLGAWPSSPGSQRGDSGVWRQIVAIIRSTGPASGSFGNGYRHGDPLWHGSGRAVDWMGYNQDALAQFFMNQKSRVLELIHTTNRGGYYITRGQRRSTMGAQNALHRNHIHVAMAGGGLVPALAGIKSYDRGGAWPSGTLGYNGSGHTEFVSRNAGEVNVHIHANVISSKRELENMLVEARRELVRQRRWPAT